MPDRRVLYADKPKKRPEAYDNLTTILAETSGKRER